MSNINSLSLLKVFHFDFVMFTTLVFCVIREVYYTRTLQKLVPDLQYYYMGFYIHSCPKMRYKGKLSPSYLLCPETYCWIPIEKAFSLLDVTKYSRLNKNADAIDVNLPKERDLSNTMIIFNQQLMTFNSFRILSSQSNALFNRIGILVGRTCLKNMVFWMN